MHFPKHILSRFLAFTLLILLSAVGFSQTSSLSTSNVSFNPDSNIAFGDTLILSYTVRNKGTTPYSGFLDVNFSTDNGITLGGLCNIPQVTLTPNGGDSVSGTCVIFIDSTTFQPGNNIVVVWSSGNGRTAIDTVKDSIFVNSTAGVNENDLSSAFTIYPSVTKDIINVETSGNILPIKIFIEDISGRIIKVISPSSGSRKHIQINTSELKSGIYFLDILMPDRRRAVSKFVKVE